MAKATKTANCSRCHALLTSPRSVAKGIGRHCEQLDRQETALAEAGYKRHQVESALELIEDGAILTVRPGLHIVVSTDGSEFYETTAHTCGCKAFEAGRKCYHRAAAVVLAA